MVFENGVKNIQAAAYNGARTVHDDYRNVASSRPVYYSILDSLGQRSQYINGLWKWGKKVYKPRLIMARVR